MQEIREIFRLESQENGLELIINVNSNIPLALLMDQVRARHVLI